MSISRPVSPPTTEEKEDYLQKTIAANTKNEKTLKIYKEVLDIYHLESNSPALNKKLNEAHKEIKVLGGNNNKNYALENSVIMQISKRSNAVDEAITKVSESGKLPVWMAKCYGDRVKRAVEYEEDTSYNLTFVEKAATSFDQKVKLLNSPGTNNEGRIQAAVKFGTQISNMLSDMLSKGVIWTDLKAENLLIRNPDHLFIADFKALRPLDKTKTKKNGSYDDEGDVTGAYLSPNHEKDFAGTLDKTKLAEKWNNEYSYQLAANIYYVATGLKINTPLTNLSPELIKDYRQAGFVIKPDFNLDVFTKSAEGVRLKYVIEQLIGDGKTPEERLRREDAVALMKNLNNPEEFRNIIVSIGVKNASGKSEDDVNKIRKELNEQVTSIEALARQAQIDGELQNKLNEQEGLNKFTQLAKTTRSLSPTRVRRTYDTGEENSAAPQVASDITTPKDNLRPRSSTLFISFGMGSEGDSNNVSDMLSNQLKTEVQPVTQAKNDDQTVSTQAKDNTQSNNKPDSSSEEVNSIRPPLQNK